MDGRVRRAARRAVWYHTPPWLPNSLCGESALFRWQRFRARCTPFSVLSSGQSFPLLALVGSALQTVSSGTGFPSQFGVLFGVGAIIIFPILYGALGFIFGLILGGLYNLLAGVVGGVEIEGPQTQSQ